MHRIVIVFHYQVPYYFLSRFYPKLVWKRNRLGFWQIQKVYWSEIISNEANTNTYLPFEHTVQMWKRILSLMSTNNGLTKETGCQWRKCYNNMKEENEIIKKVKSTLKYDWVKKYYLLFYLFISLDCLIFIDFYQIFYHRPPFFMF